MTLTTQTTSNASLLNQQQLSFFHSSASKTFPKDLITTIFNFLKDPQDIAVMRVCRLFHKCGRKINLSARLCYFLWSQTFNQTINEINFSSYTKFQQVSFIFQNTKLFNQVPPPSLQNILKLSANRQRVSQLQDQVTWPAANHAEILKQTFLKNIYLFHKITNKNPELNDYELFIIACATGEKAIVKEILLQKQFNDEIKQNGWQFAKFFQQEHILQLLDAFSQNEKTIEHLLRLAIEKNYSVLVYQLVQHKKIIPVMDHFEYASELGHIEVFFSLLQDYKISGSEFITKVLSKSAKNGHLRFLQVFLKDYYYHYRKNYSHAIKIASVYGCLKVVICLLKEEKEKFRSSSGNIALQEAAIYGHTHLVKALIEKEYCQLSSYDYSAIKHSIQYDHLETLLALLQDKRIDQVEVSHLAIQMASEQGHSKIVQALLKDSRLDPTYRKNSAINTAIQKGHIDVVTVLLKDERVNQPKIVKRAFLNAVELGSYTITESLLKNSFINVGIIDLAIMHACKQNRIEVVCLLLKDSRINPIESGNLALTLAIRSCHQKLHEILLQDKRLCKIKLSLGEKMIYDVI